MSESEDLIEGARDLWRPKLTRRNELWDQEDDNHSSHSWMPPNKPGLDSRAASSYGGGAYDYPPSRGISPAGSYADLRQSAYETSVPALPFGSNVYHGSPMGMGMGMGGIGYGGSVHGGSVYNDPRTSSYSLVPGQGQAQVHPGMESRAPSYSMPYTDYPHQQPHLQNRASSYSIQQPQAQPHYQGDFRQSSYSLANEGPMRADSPYIPQSRPQSQMQLQGQDQSRRQSFLPELATSTSGPLNAGADSIPASDLESSIRRICASADLDNLTKKGVRKQLEEEFGVGLGGRKDEIGRIIERVLSGESSLVLSSKASVRNEC